MEEGKIKEERRGGEWGRESGRGEDEGREKGGKWGRERVEGGRRPG